MLLLSQQKLLIANRAILGGIFSLQRSLMHKVIGNLQRVACSGGFNSCSERLFPEGSDRPLYCQHCFIDASQYTTHSGLVELQTSLTSLYYTTDVTEIKYFVIAVRYWSAMSIQYEAMQQE